jgi:hypothetical protein
MTSLPSSMKGAVSNWFGGYFRLFSRTNEGRGLYIYTPWYVLYMNMKWILNRVFFVSWCVCYWLSPNTWPCPHFHCLVLKFVVASVAVYVGSSPSCAAPTLSRSKPASARAVPPSARPPPIHPHHDQPHPHHVPRSATTVPIVVPCP